MTCHALSWRGLEHDHLFSLDDLYALVASGALNVAVFAGKRIPRLPVVIELCRSPPRWAVAVNANRDSIGPGELPEVILLVALFAFAGGGLEVHLL